MNTQVPENLSELNGEELAKLEGELVAEFDAAYEADASLEQLAELTDAVDRVRGEQTVQAEKAEADKLKRAEMADRVRPAADDALDADDSADADDGSAEAEADDASAEGESIEEQELVTASAAPKQTRPSAAAMRQRSSVPAAPETGSELVITASADVPGYGNGQRLDRKGIATAMHSRARGLGDAKGKSARFSVASIESPIPAEFRVSDGTVDATAEVIEAAVASKLAGSNAEALVASGGWCAPSETLYDLFSVESRDGLLDLPSIGVSRGGIQYPAYIGLSAASSGLWTWTEDNDENPGTDGPATKGCVQIPCPTFTECRLEAEGLCITHGNLSDRAYPELTARFVDLAITAHLHKLSNAQVAKIIATATAVTVASTDSDAAGDLLGAIDLQVADYRSQHLMGSNVVLDAIFPQWVIEAIRATLAMRAGVESYAVSNAEVIGFFTTRNVRPQFLAGYEPLFDTSPATAFPSTTKFVLMPAGGYVFADGGVLDLGVVRDSTLNETNDFTAAWTEQFYCVIQRGPAARVVTATTDVDGVTACCPTA